MNSNRFHATIDSIRKKDSRFSPKAYSFLLKALDHTSNKKTPSRQSKVKQQPVSHVSCHDLLEGFTEYALEKFGPMAITVLEEWGILNSYHVGEIVFQLIDARILGKQPSDSLDDFKNHLDLQQVLTAPYTPSNSESASA